MTILHKLLNAIDWRVYFVEKDNEKLQRSDGSYTLGSCDNNTNIIYLREDLYGRSLKKVLCHELTHTAMFSYQINLTLDQEELIADFIATYGEEIINITNTKITLNTVNLLGKFIYISPLCFFLLYINSKKK